MLQSVYLCILMKKSLRYIASNDRQICQVIFCVTPVLQTMMVLFRIFLNIQEKLQNM